MTTTTRRGKALSLTAAGVSLVIGALVATLATTASAAPAAKHRVGLALDGGTVTGSGQGCSTCHPR